MSLDDPKKITTKADLKGLSIDLEEVDKFQSRTNFRSNDSYMPLPSLVINDGFIDPKLPEATPNFARAADTFESFGEDFSEDKFSKRHEKPTPWADTESPLIYQNEANDFINSRRGAFYGD